MTSPERHPRPRSAAPRGGDTSQVAMSIRLLFGRSEDGLLFGLLLRCVALVGILEDEPCDVR